MEGGPKIEDYLRIVRWRPCENQGAPNLKGYTRRNSGRDLIICRSRGYGLPLSSLLSPFFGYVTPPHIVNRQLCESYLCFFVWEFVGQHGRVDEKGR